MELIPPNTKIDFVGKSRICAWISGTLVAISLASFVWPGFKLGIDFTGGTQLQVHIPEGAQGEVNEARVRTALERTGIANPEVTRIGAANENEFLIRLRTSEEEAKKSAEGTSAPSASAADEPADSSGAAVDDPDGPDDNAQDAAKTAPAGDAAAETPPGTTPPAATPAADGAAGGPIMEAENPNAGLLGQIVATLQQEFSVQMDLKRDLTSVDSIGPRVGREITTSALTSVLLTSAMILLYIWLRFDLVYAPGAVIALLHDVVVTAGVFAVFRLEVDQQVVAALLVVLGYSNNDTVVIYDRIRENVALHGKTRLADVVNDSVNQTLSRTVLTHGFTSVMVLSLLIFGGPVLRNMSLALFIGINFGTYSSVYVASTLLVWLEKRMEARGIKSHASATARPNRAAPGRERERERPRERGVVEPDPTRTR